MTTKVTVGVDSTAESQAALRWAADYADRTGATVHAAAVWDQPLQPVGPGHLMTPATEVVPPREMEESVATMLDATLTEVLGERASEVEREVVAGDPGTALSERAAAGDLLVVGNARHGALGGALGGSVALYCLKHAPCPVVLVPAPDREEAE